MCLVWNEVESEIIFIWKQNLPSDLRLAVRRTIVGFSDGIGVEVEDSCSWLKLTTRVVEIEFIYYNYTNSKLSTRTN